MVWTSLLILALPQFFSAGETAPAPAPPAAPSPVSQSETVDYTYTSERVQREMVPGEVVWKQDKKPAKPEAAPSKPSPTGAEAPRETAAPVLVETAQSEDITTRIQGLEGLAQADAMEHIDTFVAALADPVSDIREAAAAILCRLDPVVVSNRIVDGLCSGSPEDIARVDTVLPAMKPSLEPGLIRILADPDQPSLRRQAAAYTLGRINSTIAVSALLPPIYQPDADLAVTCANAVMALHDPMLTPTLINLTRHALPQIRWGALQSLADLGGPDALDALGRIALEPPEGDAELGQRAVELIGGMHADAAIPLLIEVMRRNPVLHRAAVEALQRITGQDLGERASDWQAWYEAKLQGPPPGQEMPPPGATPSPFDIEYLP